MKLSRILLLLLAIQTLAKAEEKPEDTEESCSKTACNETEINAPVGPQPPAEIPLPYDSVPGNPPRENLRFPLFQSAWGLNRSIYEKAVTFFEMNKGQIANPRYFTIVDFNRPSFAKRLYLFELSAGTVETHAVAAGKNSDSDGDGLATDFSNEPESKMSSLGFYRTLETYNGAHGLSLRLDGLNPSNSNAFKRAIVVHPAAYVSDAVPKAGRSWGCPAGRFSGSSTRARSRPAHSPAR